MERVVVKEGISQVAVALSVASGSLILAGALMPLIWLQYAGLGAGWMSRGSWMMSGHWEIMTTVSWIGIVSGALILLGAIMMNYNPTEARKWGILVLVFAVIGLFGMGGFFIGAILGIIAGAMALSRQ